MENELLKKIQSCEIGILGQIDALCKKHGLEYFSIGGTTLGAVRHEGFIPWDDDIDIAMPRGDYEKFLEVAKKELPEGFTLQHYSTEPLTPFYFTKIRRDGTRFVEYYLRDLPIHHGVFVDIFPFDNIPDNKYLVKPHYYLCRFFYQLFLSKSVNRVCSSRLEQVGQYKKGYKHYIRKTLHFLLKPMPKKWIVGALDWSCRMFNGRPTEKMAHIVRRRLAVSSGMLHPLREMKFETMTIPVPNDYDAYLRNQYGDYMTIPTGVKALGHLPYEVEV